MFEGKLGFGLGSNGHVVFDSPMEYISSLRTLHSPDRSSLVSSITGIPRKWRLFALTAPPMCEPKIARTLYVESP